MDESKIKLDGVYIARYRNGKVESFSKHKEEEDYKNLEINWFQFFVYCFIKRKNMFRSTLLWTLQYAFIHQNSLRGSNASDVMWLESIKEFSKVFYFKKEK